MSIANEANFESIEHNRRARSTDDDFITKRSEVVQRDLVVHLSKDDNAV